jgi:hypothetical protein
MTTEFDSPVAFINAWVAEKGFQRIASLGSPPPLVGELADTVSVSDAVGIDPLELVASRLSPECLVISNYLETLTRTEATELLGGYRNSLIAAVLVFVDLDEAEIGENDMLSLGFTHRASFSRSENALHAFEYGLASYNFKRDWNNSENWANPENFGKYWW